MCAQAPGLPPGLSYYSPPFRRSGRTERRKRRLCKNEILMPFLLDAGLTRSSAHFSLLENSLTAEGIETEEISTLSSHKLNQGSRDSLLCDLAAYCYLQGKREGKGQMQGTEGGRDLLVRHRRALPSFICSSVSAGWLSYALVVL